MYPFLLLFLLFWQARVPRRCLFFLGFIIFSLNKSQQLSDGKIAGCTENSNSSLIILLPPNMQRSRSRKLNIQNKCNRRDLNVTHRFSTTDQQGLSSKSDSEPPRQSHLHSSVCESIQGCERLYKHNIFYYFKQQESHQHVFKASKPITKIQHHLARFRPEPFLPWLILRATPHFNRFEKYNVTLRYAEKVEDGIKSWWTQSASFICKSSSAMGKSFWEAEMYPTRSKLASSTTTIEDMRQQLHCTMLFFPHSSIQFYSCSIRS